MPKTIRFERNISVVNTATFFLEDDDHKEVNLNGEMLTFVLQFWKI